MESRKLWLGLFFLVLFSISLSASSSFGGATTSQTSSGDTATRQLAHDIFKQLIEINTTDSVGSVTAAAEAMAQRFRDAGFPGQRHSRARPPMTARRMSSCGCTARASTSRCYSSGILTWSRPGARTGLPIRSSSSKRTATSTAAAPGHEGRRRHHVGDTHPHEERRIRTQTATLF